jgi:hypothetical protein
MAGRAGCGSAPPAYIPRDATAPPRRRAWTPCARSPPGSPGGNGRRGGGRLRHADRTGWSTRGRRRGSARSTSRRLHRPGPACARIQEEGVACSIRATRDNRRERARRGWRGRRRPHARRRHSPSARDGPRRYEVGRESSPCSERFSSPPDSSHVPAAVTRMIERPNPFADVFRGTSGRPELGDATWRTLSRQRGRCSHPPRWASHGAAAQ